jgi:predicted transcriptional regulator
MSDSSEMQILGLLAKEWAFKGPPGILDINDVAAMVSLAPSDTAATIKELFSSGLVDMNAFKTSLYLTPEGYEYYRVHKEEQGK